MLFPEGKPNAHSLLQNLSKGWFKKKLMEFSIKGPDPPTHPP